MLNRIISRLDYRAEKGIEASANFRMYFVSIIAAVLGVLAGFVAFGLLKLIAFFTNLFFYQRLSLEEVSAQHHQLGPWVIVVTVLGGVIIGLMSKYGTSKIRGHGIPEAMEAVLTNRSRISPRVAFFKPLSAAIAIGTGGPFGAEGPIIQTGGAIGSLIGQIIPTTAAERKVLLACGAAAGMAAVFNTPIAAVILAIELLLFEFKSRSFIPLVIASTMATSTHFLLIGREPMFHVGAMEFGVPNALLWYVLLGLICGLFAVGVSNLLYWIEDMFERLPFDPMWWPALGGVVLGIVALFVPRVLGVGYETIEDILNARLELSVLLLIMVAKLTVLMLTLGSGTSGGLLAPTFMVSAALGGSFAILVNQLVPGANLSPAACALVAMAAVFGAASRATFTFIIFAFEITRDYNAILPLMLVSVIADGVALLLMRNSIMTEKLARRGLRVHQEYEADVMQRSLVGEVMDKNAPTILSTMKVVDLAERIAQHDPVLTRYQGLPILNPEGKLVGIITRSDVVRDMESGSPDPNRTVLDVGSDTLVTAHPDETLHDAVMKMLAHDIGRLPVVDRKDPAHLLGYLGRSGVIAARMAHLEHEHKREESLLQRA